MVAKDVCYQPITNHAWICMCLNQRVKKEPAPSQMAVESVILQLWQLSALAKEEILKHDNAIKYVAQLLRRDILMVLSKGQKNAGETKLELSCEAASQTIPQSLLQFSTHLTSSKHTPG